MKFLLFKKKSLKSISPVTQKSPVKSRVTNNHQINAKDSSSHVNTDVKIISPQSSKFSQQQSTKHSEQKHHQEIELEETTTTATDVKLKFVYLEKEVEISRPFNYSSRGFGFLLNTGLANDFVNSELYLLVNPENAISSDTFIERLFVYENFAQIVVVEPG